LRPFDKCRSGGIKTARLKAGCFDIVRTAQKNAVLHFQIVRGYGFFAKQKSPKQTKGLHRVTAVGVQEPPENDLERFFSRISFESREKLKDLPDFRLDS
jgi:hypothetical protein